MKRLVTRHVTGSAQAANENQPAAWLRCQQCRRRANTVGAHVGLSDGSRLAQRSHQSLSEKRGRLAALSDLPAEHPLNEAVDGRT